MWRAAKFGGRATCCPTDKPFNQGVTQMIGQAGRVARWLAGAAVALVLATAPALADDTLDRGVGSEWSSLDPQVNFDAAAGWILADAYEGLVNFDPDGKIIPGAAETWEASADGKTYTFHLREGLKWSNGDPLVAQDFVNGVLRTLNPDTVSEKGYYFYSTIKVKGAAALANGETKDAAVLGVTAPDDRTVVIEMETPAPHILDLVGAFQFAPLHSPSFDAGGASVFIDPAKVVSNGAYVIKEVVPQSHVLLEKNPNYWDAANVKIPFVKYHVTEDVGTELKRYQAGEIDITYDIPLADMERLQAETPDEVRIFPSTYLIYYSFNLSNPDLQNIELRRALSLALDRDVLENKIVKGGATPKLNYAGGFDPEYKGPDIAEAGMTQADREVLAKELYAKAGYGPDNPLKLSIATTVAEVNIRRAQGAALMWKKVLGAEVEVNSMERKAWLGDGRGGGTARQGDALPRTGQGREDPSGRLHLRADLHRALPASGEAQRQGLRPFGGGVSQQPVDDAGVGPDPGCCASSGNGCGTGG
ncbi:MAG: peptide ABC transporter substrate-binding protein [Acetobacteraceae bacterium]|nr:MAG: peptide ABC transporter substrate-binding protein [Acetobacteraceae bacterium]